MKKRYTILNSSVRLNAMLILGMLLAMTFHVNAEIIQGHTVTGKVTGSLDGEGLPGVNVIIKGAQEGTITDMNGSYSLEVNIDNATLVYSYVGYNSEEVEVGGRSVIDIVLIESIEALGEVVVTALGIQREERSLGYSVGKVSGEEVTRVAQENVLNSLAGKVAGATINSTGGTGSSVSMVIRGATSLSSDNQPLFVVDGVPIQNSLNNIGEFGKDNKVDYGNAISDLNPQDIESITVLKGPSAAALYGTRAGNGVVLITTKTAKKGQGMRVSVTSNTVFDIPSNFLNTQKKFANGGTPYRPEDVGGGVLPDIYYGQPVGVGSELDRGYFALQWEAPLDANGFPVPTELVSHKDNIKNFVQTGFTTSNGLAISNSTDQVDYRISYTNMSNRGNVPNSDLFKNSISTSATIEPIKNLRISSSLNYNTTWSNNRPSSNRGTNPMQWAYNISPDIDIRDLQDYWFPGREGLEVRTLSSGFENPYFLAHEVNNGFNRDRIFGNINAEWQITPEFSVMARYVLNQTNGQRETKIAPGYSQEPNNGAYGLSNSTAFERNIDVLATYSKVWENLNITASAGGNALYAKNTNISNSSISGAGLIVPNVFSISNIASSALNYNSYWSQRAINSIYALANVGWQDWIYLDITARNDWSSTLPKEDRSYFYPSTSLSLLINEISNLGNSISLLKLRAGYAQVGNDTDPYNLVPVLGRSSQWGDAVRWNKSATLFSPDLKPEIATSIEFGLNLNMFEDRIRLDATYYLMDNEDQILENVPLSSGTGFDRIRTNAGSIESKGFELLLGLTPIKNADWNWDLNLNFSKNESVIVELAEGVDVIEFWSDNKSYSYGYVKDDASGEDGRVGNIYSPLVQRVTDPSSEYFGFPIVGEGDDPEWTPEELPTKVGNYNPDFLMGMQSRLSFKNFVLNMTFDWRSGGQYMSQTFRYFTESTQTQTWLDGLINPNGLPLGRELRDWIVANKDEILLTEDLRPVGGPTPDYGGFIDGFWGTPVYDGTFAPGVVGYHDENGKFILDHENLGNTESTPGAGDNNGTTVQPYVASFPWAFGTPAMFDADYIKLREISLGYNLPRTLANKLGMQNATVSVYSRNIMLWTKDSDFGIDPERAFQAESSSGNRGTQFKQGIERYNVDPWVIPVGFKLDLTF